MIVTTEGKRLTSPHMRYLQAQNEVSSDSRVHARRAGPQPAAGIGFKADPQLTRVQVLKRAAAARQHHPAGAMMRRARARRRRCCSPAARGRRRRSAPRRSRALRARPARSTVRGTAIKLPSGQRNMLRRRQRRRALPGQNARAAGRTASSTTATKGALFFIGNVDYTEPRLTLKSDSSRTSSARSGSSPYMQRRRRRCRAARTSTGPHARVLARDPERARSSTRRAIGRPTISHRREGQRGPAAAAGDASPATPSGWTATASSRRRARWSSSGPSSPRRAIRSSSTAAPGCCG